MGEISFHRETTCEIETEIVLREKYREIVRKNNETFGRFKSVAYADRHAAARQGRQCD